MSLPYAAAISVLVILHASCGPRGVPPAGSAAPVRTDTEAPQADTAPTRAQGDADVRFVHGMIAHHAQAIVMADMVPTRAQSEQIRLLARRIDVSQKDEILMMRRWLERRGTPVPDSAAGHAQHVMAPGMLTAAELRRLGEAAGGAFDRLFLELMIRHHEGALTMVAELFAAGGGRDPELFQIASHIDADQRAEIARMNRLLTSMDERGAS